MLTSCDTGSAQGVFPPGRVSLRLETGPAVIATVISAFIVTGIAVEDVSCSRNSISFSFQGAGYKRCQHGSCAERPGCHGPTQSGPWHPLHHAAEEQCILWATQLIFKVCIYPPIARLVRFRLVLRPDLFPLKTTARKSGFTTICSSLFPSGYTEEDYNKKFLLSSQQPRTCFIFRC